MGMQAPFYTVRQRAADQYGADLRAAGGFGVWAGHGVGESIHHTVGIASHLPAIDFMMRRARNGNGRRA
jgi:hypothetical protein